VAHYAVYSPFGIPSEIKFGRPWNADVNFQKISQLTYRMYDFVSESIYLYPFDSLHGIEDKNAKVAR
jgi:hypothetical protein